MGQDRVRPLALALQGLDYTVRGQTVGGGRERVCVWGGGEQEGRVCSSGGGNGWRERELEGAVDAVERGREEGQGSVA